MLRCFLRLLALLYTFSTIIVLSTLQSVGRRAVSPLKGLEVLVFEKEGKLWSGLYEHILISLKQHARD